MTFGPWEPWAKPIDDFLAVGRAEQPEFNKAITDLAPFGDRMFLGYGDADYNLGGKVTVEFRAFASPDDSAFQVLAVEAAGQGAPQSKPSATGEEQLDTYRVLDGELWLAGIDSTDADELWTQAKAEPKRIEGNVFRLQGDTVRKRRSIPGGEHVHDVASFQGAVYAVGSGADLRTEFEAGQVFRYLWRSRDRGETFETVQRTQNAKPKDSDTRFVHLLATSDRLYAFGFESTFSTNSGRVINAAFDGKDLAVLGEDHPLAKTFAAGTLSLPGGTGLVWGTDVAARKATALRVSADGTVAPLASLAGSTVLDVSLTETSELLYLVAAGDALDAPKTWDVQVLVADVGSPDVVTELARFTTRIRPSAIAYFRGALFLGTGDGTVKRAVVQ